MARQYEYKARDAQGQLFSGMVLADSEAAAAGFVRNKGYYVTRLKEAKPKQDIWVMLQNLRTVSIKDIARTAHVSHSTVSRALRSASGSWPHRQAWGCRRPRDIRAGRRGNARTGRPPP